MSQNKTVTPGLDAGYGQQGPFGEQSNYNFYGRDYAQEKPGTVVVSAMQGGASAGPDVPPAPPVGGVQPSAPGSPAASGKPIVGFLYSLSRDARGEFWPLHIGPNVIGTSATCDVVLPEATVSQEHAVLMVRTLKKSDKSAGPTIASICDSRSTNGTLLNGDSLAFSPVECKNGDYITVGENYVLYLILIDAAALGLKPADNFIPAKTATPAAPDAPSVENGGTVDTGSVPPPYSGDLYGGTVGLNGLTPNLRSGHTVGMD